MKKRTKIRRMIATVLTLCMTISMMAVGSFTASSKVVISKDGLWGYTVYYDDLADREMVCIGNYYGEESSLTLPTEIDGLIPNEVSLLYTPNLKSIHIPKNYVLCSSISDTIEIVTFDRDYTEAYVELQYHGSAAFEGCKTLKKVVLPNLMVAEKDKDKIVIRNPDGSTKESYWDYLTGLLPASLFRNCTKLEEVVLPDNIERIGSQCFENCKSLKTLTIPEGVRKIDDYAFKGTNLEYIYVPSTLEDGYVSASTIVAPEESFPYKLAKYSTEEYDDVSITLINTTPTDIIGDVNGDNELNINDVTLMQKRLVQAYPFELNNYDINGDGKFNIWDATFVQRQLAQMIE